MKVLVTGAAGRVGANLTKQLVSSGWEVRAMVTPGSTHAAKLASVAEAEVVEADLRDQRSVSKACRGVTHVVHLAARMVVGDLPIDDFYDVNTLGTLRLLEGVLHESPDFERFVLASTDSTYRPGRPPATPLTEDLPQEPADYYGTSKLLGEIILRNRAEQFQIPFSIVRFGTVLSPDEAATLYRLGYRRGWLRFQQERGRKNTLWPLFEGQPKLVDLFDEQVGDAPDDTAVSLVGPDGPWTLSMVDVRDAAQGARLALTEPGAVGRAFNIAAAEPTSSVEGAAAVSEVFGVPALTVRLPLTWNLEISIEEARKHLGYEPAYDYRACVGAAKAQPTGADDFIPAAEGNTGVFAALSGGHTQ
ncbi:Nucleoside-diphosphate-sugar epimerase [Amycolatopsis sacchari]|uniref:Nucleoside-diphosphate-sugar epimerase n=1 Tax=Amycolatopsis sacchari TaxID=115433 RepID=A0A1I3LWW9_9PSEU|nr:NAD(P)-dependent oxidoreductase [Amycolatopsis sacchari]SFI89229.1 Nucleoside-diphosphate-sugar epimerase [Amycolatopsis sacchari]